MPYLNIETNERYEEIAVQEFLKKVSAFTAKLLGKPEQWLMASVSQGVPMIFGGTTQPTAFVALKSIGLSQERCADLARSLCDFMAKELGMPPDRIYIEFRDLNGKMFGWNGGTFS